MRTRDTLVGTSMLIAAAVVTGGIAWHLSGKSVRDHLNASAMVSVADGSSGSCVFFRNGDTVFAWTDAHVVEGARRVQTGIDPATGKNRTYMHYDDVWLITSGVVSGRKASETHRSARILRFSKKHDLALLLLSDPDSVTSSVSFAERLPSEGDQVWHVGSMHGKPGENSVSDGCIAKIGRLRSNFAHDDWRGLVYDQVSIHAHKGSSGGGVFSKKTGDCLGLVTEFLDYDSRYGLSYGALFITPARRIRQFARESGVEFAVTTSVSVPPEKDLLASVVTAEPLPARQPVSQGAVPGGKVTCCCGQRCFCMICDCNCSHDCECSSCQCKDGNDCLPPKR